jgi:hypothetical protein
LAPSEFDKVAKISDFGKGKTLTQSEMTGLGALRPLGEGEAISFDSIEDGHKKSISTVKFGLGFQATEEMQNDELSGNVGKIPQSMADSASYCIETNFWNLFNGGFSGGGVTAWDGQPVFASHTLLKPRGTTTAVSNLGSVDLSTTAFEAAQLHFDTLLTEEGHPMMLKPNKLIISPAQRSMALQLLKASGWVWNAELGQTAPSASIAGATNMLNSANSKNGFFGEWQPIVSHYLTDANSDSWFMLADKHTFSFYWRKKPTMSSKDDFNTDNKLFKIVVRFATAVWDWRGSYGSPGA